MRLVSPLLHIGGSLIFANDQTQDLRGDTDDKKAEVDFRKISSSWQGRNLIITGEIRDNPLAVEFRACEEARSGLGTVWSPQAGH